jgi:hypothetical protein
MKLQYLATRFAYKDAVTEKYTIGFKRYPMNCVFSYAGLVWCIDPETLNITETTTGYKILPLGVKPDYSEYNLRLIKELIVTFIDSKMGDLPKRITACRNGYIEPFIHTLL